MTVLSRRNALVSFAILGFVWFGGVSTRESLVLAQPPLPTTDTTNPEIDCPSCISDAPNAKLEGEATDDMTSVSVRAKVGANIVDTDNEPLSSVPTVNPFNLCIGSYPENTQVTVEAEDQFGNIACCTVTVLSNCSGQ